MLASFCKYLVLNKKAIMPGVGVFTVTKKPALFDADRGVFSAPMSEFNFAEGNAMADKQFYNFLKNEHQIDEVSAIRQFNEFSCVLWEGLHSKKVIDFPNIGSLVVNKEGVLIFNPIEDDLVLFPDISNKQIPLVLPEIVQSKVETPKPKKATPVIIEKVSTKDEAIVAPKNYWWVVAIGLAIVSIAAIVYYYTVIL